MYGIIFIILFYISGIIYFRNHFYFRSYLNNINISLCSIKAAEEKVENKIKNYKITIVDKDNINSVITGENIYLKYKDKNIINNILRGQNSFLWIFENFTKKEIFEENLFSYDNELLEEEMKKIPILNENIKEPQDAYLKYNNRAYEIINEEKGNKINQEKFYESLKENITAGEVSINLENEKCYYKPKYLNNSLEVVQAKNKAEKYLHTKVEYDFEGAYEMLDHTIINKFINIDENFNVTLNEKKVQEYVSWLAGKYDTYEGEREFLTSNNKKVIIKGGNYGFRIDKNREKLQILNEIENGENIKREPVYIQKALCRGKDDLGKNYVEINITQQHLWYYKDGKLVTQGDVVTGNEARGLKTPSGVYSLNYKAKDVVLKGDNYSSKVKYWMPFNGNIGLHDAYWRGSFGGNIYKNNGTHGCVNMPYYLAKKIYENIDEKVPIICYRE